MNGSYYIGPRVSSFEAFRPSSPVDGIILVVDDENAYFSGAKEGNLWTIECPYGSQAMADNIMEAVRGQTSLGYKASGAPLPPDAELGDAVTVCGSYVELAERHVEFGPGHLSEISAPGNQEVDEEYEYVPPGQRKQDYRFAQTYSQITKTAEEIRMEIVDEIQDASASFDLKLDGLSTSFEDKLSKQAASFDVKLDGLEADFSDQIEGLSSEFSAGLDGLSFRLDQVSEKFGEDLADFSDTVTGSLANLQAQIDGQVETHFYDYDPTLNNPPASEWKDDLTRTKHEGDLFFNRTTGHAYRFFKDGNTWKWELVRDTDITKALAAAEAAQDTADNKRRVFTEQPKPPYDEGDLWAEGPTGDLMLCIKSRASGAFVQSDWDKASKYTDDSALNTFLTGQYKTDIDNIKTQADQKAETWYQDGNPADAWTTDTLKAEHKGDMWYCTGSKDTTHYQKFWRWDGGTWQEMTSTPPSEVFDQIDGKAQIFIAQPKPPYREGDLWFDSATSDIMTCVHERLTGDYDSGDWEKRNKYTDDTTANTAISRTVELAADLEKITARVTSTETTTEELNQSAIISSVEQFYQSDSATSLTGGKWEDKQPAWVQGKYIWTRRLITYGDKHQAYSPSETGVCITGNTGAAGTPGAPGAPGKDGDPGSNGRGIKTITNHYLASPKNSGVTKDTAGWTTTIQTIDATKKYLWNYETIDYDDGSSMETVPVIIGTFGTNGSNGTNGVGIASIDEHYLASAQNSGVTVSTPGWTPSVQNTTTEKRYLWNYETINFTDNSHSDHAPRIIGTHGATGSPGQNGVGVSEIEPQYYLSTSPSDTVGGTWGTTVPETTDGTYLWTRDKITYTDGNVEYTKPWNMTTPMLGSINSVVERVSELEVANESITARVESTEKSITSLDEKTAELELRDDSITSEVHQILYYTGRNYVHDSDTALTFDRNTSTHTLRLTEPLKVGTQYSFRIWYDGTGGRTNLNLSDSVGNVFGKFNITGTTRQDSQSIKFTVSSASSSANLDSISLSMTYGSMLTPFTVSRVKLEEGEYSTDWSPAPEDDPSWTPETIMEKLSRLSQTADGFEATVQDLESGLGQTLRLAADGVTITNAAGSKLTIDGGQIKAETLNLTGCITFSDLDKDTQNRVDEGISESEATTLITSTLVSSPRIEGADIYGGTFHDSDGLGNFELTWETSGSEKIPGITFETADGDPIFQVMYLSGASVSTYGGIISMAGMPFLGTTRSTITGTPTLVTTAYGNWVFTGSVAGINSLELRDETTPQTGAQGDPGMEGPSTGEDEPKETPKVKLLDKGGKFCIETDGVTWYLDANGLHQ